jgi:UDP-N-acetylglucosamine acyltransferase
VSAAQAHPTALVHPAAQLADGVTVGAFSIIGEQVTVGEGTWIGPHVVIEGRTRIGRANRIHSFSALGGTPQDKKYADEDTAVEIGDGNTLREYVTVNRGTVHDARVTRIGDDNWVMAYVHVAHDCQVGSHAIFANACQLAGHVHIGDWAILGGATLVHQFVRVGAHSFTGMGACLGQDLPPYVMAAGCMAKPFGINSEGLRRRGFPDDVIVRIKRAYRTLYRSGLSLADATRDLSVQSADCREVGAFLDFLSNSKRGFIR